MELTADWTGDERLAGNVRRRVFVVRRAAGPVPGTVWTPDASGPLPLVLLGHGGSGDRHSARVTSLADRLAAAGIAAAAIDGPYHGERVAAPLSPAAYQARIAAEGVHAVLDRMAGDWLAARDLLADAGIADRTQVGYAGLSMGTRFGLDAAAALGGALRCAVFGKFGTRPASALNPALHTPDRCLRAASRVTAPVLFHLSWDDELFPRAGQLELFDAFAGEAKELLGFAGGHRHTPGHAPDLWLAFLVRHLTRAPRTAPGSASGPPPGSN